MSKKPYEGMNIDHYDVVTQALIIGAIINHELKKIKDKECNQSLDEVNLPLYGIEWRDRLTYQQFAAKYGARPLPTHQLPQCHICTRFDTSDNPLFAYAILDSGKFIYRCLKSHGHDQGMEFIDVQTGVTIYV